MKTLSCVVLCMILIGQVGVSVGRRCPDFFVASTITTTSSSSSSSGKKPPLPSSSAWNLPTTKEVVARWRIRKQTMQPTEDPSSPSQSTSSKPFFSYKTRIHMILEALLEAIVASEVTNGLAFLCGVDPTKIIFGINCFVNVLWKKSFKDLDLHGFMMDHFVQKSNDLELQQGRKVHTILLSGFSHIDKNHFASNMGALLVLGPQVSKSMMTGNNNRDKNNHRTNRRYSYFYIASIYASSLFDHCYRKKKKGNSGSTRTVRVLFWKFTLPSRSLGASGAISALVTYYTLKYPTQMINTTEMIEAGSTNILMDNPASSGSNGENKEKDESSSYLAEIPAWFFGLSSLLSDLFPPNGSNIGHGAHLGGHLFGATIFLMSHLWKKVRQERPSSNKKRSRRRDKGHQGVRSWLEEAINNLSRLGRDVFWAVGEAAAELRQLLEEEKMKDDHHFKLPSRDDSLHKHKDTTNFDDDLSQFYERVERRVDELKSELVREKIDKKQTDLILNPHCSNTTTKTP